MRHTQGGSSIANFGLAVNRRWKDKNSGEDRDETMFIDISVFGRGAELAHQYLSKGRRVLVEGRLVLDTWEDKNGGGKRSKHSIAADNIQFLDSKGDRDNSGESNYSQQPSRSYDNKPSYNQPSQPSQPAQNKAAPNMEVDSGDEIPF